MKKPPYLTVYASAFLIESGQEGLILFFRLYYPHGYLPVCFVFGGFFGVDEERENLPWLTALRGFLLAKLLAKLLAWLGLGFILVFGLEPFSFWPFPVLSTTAASLASLASKARSSKQIFPCPNE